PGRQAGELAQPRQALRATPRRRRCKAPWPHFGAAAPSPRPPGPPGPRAPTVAPVWRQAPSCHPRAAGRRAGAAAAGAARDAAAASLQGSMAALWGGGPEPPTAGPPGPPGPRPKEAFVLVYRVENNLWRAKTAKVSPPGIEPETSGWQLYHYSPALYQLSYGERCFHTRRIAQGFIFAVMRGSKVSRCARPSSHSGRPATPLNQTKNAPGATINRQDDTRSGWATRPGNPRPAPAAA
ncbi:MAG: hypothetical protein J3K34DRAFT_495741, partial [Monoraphidium minutum]